MKALAESLPDLHSLLKILLKILMMIAITMLKLRLKTQSKLFIIKIVAIFYTSHGVTYPVKFPVNSTGIFEIVGRFEAPQAVPAHQLLRSLLAPILINQPPHYSHLDPRFGHFTMVQLFSAIKNLKTI